jgi:DNA-binding transcriptional regulator LsrR (DeoR family)
VQGHEGRRAGDISAIEFDDEKQMLVRVCWAYYREGLTQVEIASALGLTRKRVIQILAQGRETGIVKISIPAELGLCVEQEQALRERYDLNEARVAPAPLKEVDIRRIVGAALGAFLNRKLFDGARVGLGWGGTLAAATHYLQAGNLRNLTVTQLVGGLAWKARFNPFDNASRFSSALGAACNYLPAPMIADSEALRDAYLSSVPVATVLDGVADLDIVVLTAVDLTEKSGALEYSAITRDEWRSLRDSGAVGDICGHYLDARGGAVDHPIVNRVITAEAAKLRAVPRRILAAGGVHKAAIVRAALHAGFATDLITDEACARTLLEDR